MTTGGHRIAPQELAASAARLMENHRITACWWSMPARSWSAR